MSRPRAWLNITDSGNETSAHVQTDTRMTVMFCAVEGARQNFDLAIDGVQTSCGMGVPCYDYRGESS